ncbi:MAG: hypothetical protein N2234_02630, partial [Planctomycetota bacterium]|nr:hypothetical protein [Planctomycetota bacterium]
IALNSSKLAWVELLVFLCLSVAGCHLPRSTPLADCRIKGGSLALRGGVIGRSGGDESVEGCVVSATFGLTDFFGINCLFQSAELDVRKTDSWFAEWGTGLDFVLQTIETKTGAMAVYLGASVAESRWRNFFEDDDVLKIETEATRTLYIRMGSQSEFALVPPVSLELYFDLEFSPQWGYLMQYWTVGGNILVRLMKEISSPKLFLGYSVTSSTDTVVKENYLLTAGVVLRW